jgi:hypothetical protein
VAAGDKAGREDAINFLLDDWADWRDPHERQVIEALIKADFGDPDPIAQLLESTHPLSPLSRYYLDNLIARGNNPAAPKMSKAARQQLRDMLRPDREPSAEERRTLAESFRVGIPRPNTAPPAVAYNKTYSERMFLLAREHMYTYGETRKQAAKALAETFGLDAVVLANMLKKGGQGATRREKDKFKKWMASKKKSGGR